jgi:hypothetical protein
MGQVKPEHGDGVIFWSRDVRHRVLSALLANAGLRRVVSLASRRVWEEAVRVYAASVAYDRALAADRAGDTRTARYQPAPAPTPVVRPEFVAVPDNAGWPCEWARHCVAQPFHDWYFDTRREGQHDIRVIQIGYLTLNDYSEPRADLLVLREPMRLSNWPLAADVALVIVVAAGHGDVLFDWEIRRPAYFAGGVKAVWVIDLADQRILRQRQGEHADEVQYREAGQTVAWFDETGKPVVVKLVDLFGGRPASTSLAAHERFADFATFNASELARLQRFETPWTVGHTPQWFEPTLSDLLGRFKDELWDGVLFGPEHRRDEILSALLANVGLHEVIKLAPLELWQRALDEDHRPVAVEESLPQQPDDSI